MVVELKKDGRGYEVDDEFYASGEIGGNRIGDERVPNKCSGISGVEKTETLVSCARRRRRLLRFRLPVALSLGVVDLCDAQGKRSCASSRGGRPALRVMDEVACCDFQFLCRCGHKRLLFLLLIGEEISCVLHPIRTTTSWVPVPEGQRINPAAEGSTGN
ncbi:hypothetical protein ACLB2K_077073 [Fragaria x ananassa]